jgi:hypothetical protein
MLSVRIQGAWFGPATATVQRTTRVGASARPPDGRSSRGELTIHQHTSVIAIIRVTCAVLRLIQQSMDASPPVLCVLVLGGAATAPCTAAHTRRGRNCAACPGDRRDTCERTFASVSQSHHRTTSAASEWGRCTPESECPLAARFAGPLAPRPSFIRALLTRVHTRGTVTTIIRPLYDNQTGGCLARFITSLISPHVLCTRLSALRMDRRRPHLDQRVRPQPSPHQIGQC